MRRKINRNAQLSIISLFIAACLLISCNGGSAPAETAACETGTETSAAETVSEEITEEAFVPIIRFAVCSDIHINGDDCEQGSRLEKLFDSAYGYAEGQEYVGLDAVIMVGDMTDYGYKSQYATLNRIITEKRREGTQIITVMGNHEQFGGNIADYEKSTGETANKHIVINGFHFIGISTMEYPDFNNYSDETAEWLQIELEKAAEDSGEKPIFTFQHLHISETVYGSGLTSTPKSPSLKNAYGKYPQVVNFSGDSHAPINNPNSIYQNDCTYVNTGTLYYFEMENDTSMGILPLGKENAAQYLIVEVDANDTVKIRPYNILTDSFFKTPSNTDNSENELIYTVANPSDKSGFGYTEEASKSVSNPYFAENASVTVNGVASRSVTLAIPQAFDDYCVYSYLATAIPTGGGETVGYSFLSEYYFEPLPDKLTFTVNDLQPGTEYEIAIVPVNAFNKKGNPITVKVKTNPFPEFNYSSKNPVTYSGTFTDFESLEDIVISEDGDVFAGDADLENADSRVTVRLCENGCNGSTGLAVSRIATGNSAIAVNATPENKNTVDFNGAEYLRVYIDMTGLDFRKAGFGIIGADGVLYSTDNNDGNRPEIYLLADGRNEWKTVKTGTDGCFGAQESEPLLNYKGWIAVRISDMRSAGGIKSIDDITVKSIYMYWDYWSMDMVKTEFVIDEIHLVTDYTAFDEYSK